MLRKIFTSSLFKSAGIYTVASTINSAIPFFLMPVLTRYMSPDDYGIVAMFGVLLGLTLPFTGLNVDSSIQRQYYEKKKIELSVYIGNCLLILICSSALIFLIFYLFAEPISKLSSFPKSWLWVVIAVSISQFITFINLTLWQVQLKSRTYCSYQIAQTILNVGLSIWFVVGLGMAWQGRIQAQLFTMIAFGCLGLFLLHKGGWIKLTFSKIYIYNALSFGLPLVPHVLGGAMMTMTDRFFITNMVGLTSTGLYSVGCQVGMVISLIETSFNRAYVPWLFERLKKNKRDINEMIVKVTYVYFFCLIVIVLGLSMIAPWFLSFFVGEEFAGANVYVFWIALAYAFSGMYKMVVNYIFYVQKTYFLAGITFFCGLMNVVLNYFFIKRNGAVGAAQAVALTFFLFFILTWILSNRVYKMPWLLSWSEHDAF
jgi:O-antigen/teichoic acid export membrane protein